MTDVRNGKLPKDDQPVRVYYLRAELRRSAIWSMLGIVLIFMYTIYIRVAIKNLGFNFNIPVMMGFVGTSLFIAFLSRSLLSQLRVDNEGIWLRRFRHWDCWTWDAFASGKIRIGTKPQSYEFPELSILTKRLNLAIYEEADADELDGLIRSVWVPAAPAEVPEALNIKVEWPTKATLKLSQEYLTVERAGRESVYRWEDVVGIEIWRYDGRSPNFRDMTVELPDQKLVIRTTREDSELLSLYIYKFANIEPQRIRDYALDGKPQTLNELEARIALEVARLKEMMRAKWLARWLMVIMSALVPFMFKWPVWLVQLALVGFIAWSVLWLAKSKVADCEKRVLKLENYRHLFSSEDSPAPAH